MLTTERITNCPDTPPRPYRSPSPPRSAVVRSLSAHLLAALFRHTANILEVLCSSRLSGGKGNERGVGLHVVGNQAMGFLVSVDRDCRIGECLGKNVVKLVVPGVLPDLVEHTEWLVVERFSS